MTVTPCAPNGRTGRIGQHPRHAEPRQSLPVQPWVYRQRNAVERFFNKLKHFRAVPTRYDKRDDNFLASIKLASIRIWLRNYESVSVVAIDKPGHAYHRTRPATKRFICGRPVNNSRIKDSNP
jgi:hypothetical protein